MVTGTSIEEVRRNLQVALCFHLGSLQKDGKPITEPKSQSGSVEVCLPGESSERVLNYGVIFVRVGDGYSAYVPDITGLMGQAATVAELTLTMRDKILEHLRRLQRTGDRIAAPATRCESIGVNATSNASSHKLSDTGFLGVRGLHASQVWWDPTTSQLVAASRQQQLVKRVRLEASWGGEIELDFVLIPKGRFEMGSPSAEVGRDPHEIQHQVNLSNTFYSKATPVTHSEWAAVMGTRPWHFKRAHANAPVESISWFDAVEFCNRLSKLEGLRAVYKIKDVKRRENGTIGSATVLTNFKRNGYRLPTEAEWEYSCRAETQTSTYAGPLVIVSDHNSPNLDRIAWYSGNSGVDYDGGFDSTGWTHKQYSSPRAGPHPVGQKNPNGFGLYDTLGNVWEWCWDRYEAYRPGIVTDPQGSNRGQERIFRGGAWSTKVQHCRAANRCKIGAGERAPILGFRPVCSL